MLLKIRRLVLLLSAALVLTSLLSCSTPQEKPVVEPVAVVNPTVEVARSIASIASALTSDDAVSLEKDFQDVLRSASPGAATKEQMDHAVRLFYRTQALLNAYDAHLSVVAKDPNASGVALMTDASYADLLAAWSIREEMHGRIRYFYTRTLQTQTDRGNESVEARNLQDRALIMNSMFKKSLLTNASASDRIAKQDLLFDLIEVNRAVAQVRKSNLMLTAPDSASTADPLAAMNVLLEKQLIEDPNELRRFYSRNSSTLKRSVRSSQADTEMNDQIAKRSAEMKQALNDQFDTRTPQATSGYVVGSGPSGMMSGNSFRSGRWALTFDDGPHASYTKQVLANLQKAGLKATFFWLAQNVRSNANIVAQVQAAGMDVADHSYSHPQLPKLGAAGLQREIVQSARDEAAVYGIHPKLFRCPYGACGPQNSLVRQMIANEGMLSVIWNIDSLDWQDKNPASVYARVKKQMAVQKKGIILFHDIHPQSVAASKMLMADFVAGRKTGQYRTLTIQEAMDESNSPGGMQ